MIYIHSLITTILSKKESAYKIMQKKSMISICQFIFMVLIAVILNSACTDAILDEQQEPHIINFISEEIPQSSTDPAIVTQTDIENIIKRTCATTKSLSQVQQGYSVQVIKGNSDMPVMYAVNFTTGGFMLISATKNYYPILAYSETGNFSTNHNIGGLDEWQNLFIKNIEESFSQPSDTILKYRSMWHKYSNKQYIIPTTKNDNPFRYLTTEEFMRLQKILQDSVMSWQSKGFNTYDVYQIPPDCDISPEEWAIMLEGAIYPLYQDCIRQLSVIVEREVVSYSRKVANFLQTTWDQEPGYNAYYPFIDTKQAPAGCGPVALAQVMKYYEHPNNFNWNAMSSDQPTDETARLLFDIAERCDAKYSPKLTTVTFNKSKEVLKSYGYSINANPNWSISSDCYMKKPIITCGRAKNENEDVGHMWVISGCDHTTIMHRFEVWTFKTKDRFEMLDYYSPTLFSTDYDYMNWGWGGYLNGYYLTPLEYTEGREYMHGITPIR